MNAHTGSDLQRHNGQAPNDHMQASVMHSSTNAHERAERSQSCQVRVGTLAPWYGPFLLSSGTMAHPTT